MSGFSRRDLFRDAAASAALIPEAVRNAAASPLGLPIGCQTYPVRDMIGVDFPGTIKQLSSAGFQTIELCSPKGYEKGGFAPVAKYKGSELRRLFGDIGVECHSSHFSIHELREDLSAAIAWAKDVGFTQMIVPTLNGPHHPTMDDVKRLAEECNRMAEQVAGAGIQFGLHNEEFEMSSVDGKRTYDTLFDLLDPKLVKFQFQCSTVRKGFIAADYFTKYPGRFISMHVQDWSPQSEKVVPVGQGVIDWTKTFAAAKTGGVKNYFVEMDLDLMRASVPYLRSLQVG